MAASFSQPPFFSSLVPNKPRITYPSSIPPKRFPTFKISSSNSEPSSPEPQPDKATGVKKEVPLAVKLALERANEYKKEKKSNDGLVETADSRIVQDSGPKGSPDNKKPIKNSSGKKEELKLSSIDFVGFGFSDKKSGRSLPAGLVPQSDPFPGEFPEVEILIGDTSSFNDGLTESKGVPVQENDDQVYKPKVSTWGVFPRPSNISKAYGGGRTIRPGEALETAEVRAAKEARTKQLIAAYKARTSLNIDPKLKSECEKALKDGDLLLDLGELKEALPFYESVMEKMDFKTELHGLAALQWSICQDSLSRSNEARVMYEKLQSHPSPKVSKRARQFVFSFKAMQFMKVTSSSSPPINVDYQNYFDEFLQDKKNYTPEEGEADQAGLSQALPYILFLVSPVFMVILIACSRL